MTSLILAGYTVAALITLFSTLVVIGSKKPDQQGAAAVVIVLMNALVICMLLYGLFHVPGLSA